MLLVSPRSNIIVERFRVNSSRQTLPFSLFLLSFPLFSYIPAVKLAIVDNIVEGEGGYTFHTFGRHMTRHVASLLILLVNLLIIEIVWLLSIRVSQSYRLIEKD